MMSVLSSVSKSRNGVFPGHLPTHFPPIINMTLLLMEDVIQLLEEHNESASQIFRALRELKVYNTDDPPDDVEQDTEFITEMRRLLNQTINNYRSVKSMVDVYVYSLKNVANELSIPIDECE